MTKDQEIFDRHDLGFKTPSRLDASVNWQVPGKKDGAIEVLNTCCAH